MIHDSAQDIETPSPGLRLGASGWIHDNGSRGFYPEDLPEDWRLTYYANAFSCVLVPVAEWLHQPDPEHWLDQVPGDFRFYLEAPNRAEALAHLRPLAEGLGEQLGGIVGDRPVPDVAPELQYCHEPGAGKAQGIWTPEHPVASPLALLSLQESDIKTWRHWLEQFSQDVGGQPGALLVSDDPVDMQKLQQLKTLLELMGF